MRTIAIVVCLSLLPSLGLANHIGLYSDPVNLCWVTTPPIGFPFDVYVILRPSTSTTSAAYRVQASLPAGAIVIGEPT